MKRIFFNLSIALSAFGISLAVGSFWNNYNSVDKKLASAIYAVHMQNIEQSIEKNCKTVSPEKCEKYKQQIAYESIAGWVEQDVANANQNCREKKLSEAQCAARKEAAIRDIEENMLD